MERIEDGGPAFPALYEYTTHGDRHTVPLTAGMSLRDWFAGQALAGFCVSEINSNSWADGYAASAYKVADAMLKARAR